MLAWRGVEAQHVASTMRLVDDPDEQLMLEQILEVSKPPKPAMKVPKHYLLATPFRYRPQHPSRFRQSVRAPTERCAAVLDVEALEMVEQGKTQQTWHCKATRTSVMMVHGADRYVWNF